MLDIIYNKQNIQVYFDKKKYGELPVSLENIYNLFNAIPVPLLEKGISLQLKRKDILNPMAFELFLHVIMANMVHCVHPKIHAIFKKNRNLIGHSLDAEINYIENTTITNNINHIHILRNFFKNVPVIIALPGPSLDLEYIKHERKKSLLISAGRAAEKLLKAQIYPDFIYIQDVNTPGWKKNFDLVRGRKIPSILIANPLGKIIPYKDCFTRIFKPWNMYSFENDMFPGMNRIASSSASGALSIARHFGCNPLLFVGNDCGENISPPDINSLPERHTNLEYIKNQNDIIFKPDKKSKNIFLRFGDELCIKTMNEYVAGSQWIKMISRIDNAATNRTIFDYSKTRLCQFNSIIKDISEYKGTKNNFNLPKLPYYINNNKPKMYLNHKKNAYKFILRKLNKGIVPKSALSKPYNSIFTNSSIWKDESSILSQADIDIAKNNCEVLINHINNTLSNIV